MLQIIGITSIVLVVGFTFWAAFHDSNQDGQTMRESIIESWSNIAIGFCINYTANLIVLPLAGFNVTMAGAFWIGSIFTAISVVRSFTLRRIFNWRTVKEKSND